MAETQDEEWKAQISTLFEVETSVNLDAMDPAKSYARISPEITEYVSQLGEVSSSRTWMQARVLHHIICPL